MVDLAKLLVTHGDTAGDAAAVSEAAQLLLNADNQKSARAAWELAALQIATRGGGHGASEALRQTFQQAYDQGSGEAAFGLAISYLANSETALAWLDKGAARQDWRSSYARSLYDSGTALEAALVTAAKATREQYMAWTMQAGNRDARVVMPVPLQTPAPRLPVELSVISFKGSAVAEFIVGENGEPQAIKVVGATHPQLEPAVQEAVARWKFKPGVRNGAYYPQVMRVPFRFQSGK